MNTSGLQGPSAVQFASRACTACGRGMGDERCGGVGGTGGGCACTSVPCPHSPPSRGVCGPSPRPCFQAERASSQPRGRAGSRGRALGLWGARGSPKRALGACDQLAARTCRCKAGQGQTFRLAPRPQALPMPAAALILYLRLDARASSHQSSESQDLARSALLLQWRHTSKSARELRLGALSPQNDPAAPPSIEECRGAQFQRSGTRQSV
jgi:hypothetical protein